jgi:hypothetical protein
MLIPKERFPTFDQLPQGSKHRVKGFNETEFIVTRLGLATLDELQAYPFQNVKTGGGHNAFTKHDKFGRRV